MKKDLGANPLIMVLPIGAEQTFKGIVHLIEMKAYIWGSDEFGAKFEITDIPEDMKNK